MGAQATAGFDVGVVGAGPAGLAAACLTAASGVRVALIGPRGGNAGDARTSALFAGAIRMLDAIGVWRRIAPAAAPLEAMRIVDRVSRPDHPSVIVFEASEIGDGPFGYNVPNPDLTAALEETFAAGATATRISVPVVDIVHEAEAVRLVAEDGATSTVRLVVAADGRHSRARHAAGIGAGEWDYRQTALATRIVHDDDHHNISTEIHRPGGPLTTVPLPGRHSAIVWLERAPEMAEIARLGRAALESRLAGELDGLLGTTAIDGPWGLFPVRGLSVDTIAGSRTVLIGEAAHVVPPIGAQGLNLGLRDAAWIAEVAAEALAAGRDPGEEAALSRYRRARAGDIATRRAASDLLNRSLLLDSAMFRGLRGLGLAALAGLGPVRRSLMREGIVRDRDLPAVMRARS